MFSGRASQNRSGQRRRSRIAGPVSHRRPFRRRWRRRTIVSAGPFSGVGRARRGPWFPRSRFSCLWCGDAFALDGLNEVHGRRGAHDGDGFADHVVAEVHPAQARAGCHFHDVAGPILGEHAAGHRAGGIEAEQVVFVACAPNLVKPDNRLKRFALGEVSLTMAIPIGATP